MIIVFALIIVIVALYPVMILGSVDALDQPREAWSLAGYRRNSWVWQALGVFCVPVGIVYSGLYFFRVRRRLRRVTRELAFERFRREANLRPAELPAGPHPAEIRIGVPWSVVAVLAISPLLSGAACLLAAAAARTSDRRFLLLTLDVIVFVLTLAVIAANHSFGITLNSEALLMRGFLRRRVAWPDVVAITQHSSFGARYVRLWTSTDRSRRLRAPVTCFGVGRRHFETDFAAIQQWWLAHVRTIG